MTHAISLSAAFDILGTRLGIDAGILLRYAEEDHCGGYHANAALAKWPMGSTWEVEGKVIYALVRALRPEHVVEIGTFRGAGATHILAALHANDYGRLTCCDITGCGDMIPVELRERCTILQGRGQDLLPQIWPAQFVFEDASHLTDDVAEIMATINELEPKPRLVVSHDAEHFTVGPQVREGYRRVFGDSFGTMLIAPSDCGLGYKVF